MKFASIFASDEDDAISSLFSNEESAVAAPLNRMRRFPIERLFLTGDMVALLVAFALGGAIAWAIDHYVGKSLTDIYTFSNFRQFCIYVAIGSIALVWLGIKGHYVQRLPRWEKMSHVASVMMIGLFVNGFMQFAAQTYTSRLWLISSWLCFGCLMFLSRQMIRRWLMAHDKWTISVLLIGDGPGLSAITNALHAEAEMGYKVVGIESSLMLEALTTPGAWAKLMKLTGANHIVLAMQDHKIDRYQGQLKALVYARLPYSLVPTSSSLPFSTLSSHYLFTHGVTILHHINPLELILPRLIKRSFDIVVSALALLILSPFLLILTILVKHDGGPVLFVHKRIGQHCKRFSCLKFRSMVADGDAVLKDYLAENPEAMAEWQTEWKLRKDPRVTKLGHFLRKSSFDELPQLLNVLKGDMSLVGPRPIVMAESTEYDSDIALYYMVRPGITGLWQISGRNEVTYRERVEMDSRYIRNWSFWHEYSNHPENDSGTSKSDGGLLKLFTALTLALGVVAGIARAEDIPFFQPYPRIDTGHWQISDGWTNGVHQSCEWRKDALSTDDKNLVLTLSDKGGKIRPLGCPEIHTKNLTGYGRYEARMKAAAGSGLNSNFFTYIGPPTGSPQHDEIDFEFLGKDPRSVQLNYHSNGVGGHEKIVPLGFDASADFHDYAFEWDPSKIRWYVDGKLVLETQGGAHLPINPGRIYLSLWSGAPVENAWLGPFTYTKPVSAEVQSVKFIPYNRETH